MPKGIRASSADGRKRKNAYQGSEIRDPPTSPTEPLNRFLIEWPLLKGLAQALESEGKTLSDLSISFARKEKGNPDDQVQSLTFVLEFMDEHENVIHNLDSQETPEAARSRLPDPIIIDPCIFPPGC